MMEMDDDCDDDQDHRDGGYDARPGHQDDLDDDQKWRIMLRRRIDDRND